MSGNAAEKSGTKRLRTVFLEIVMNELFSICVPTYNRAAILDGTLEELIRQAEPHRIPIYIADNVSTDETPAVVKRWQRKYSLLFYHRNKAMAKNFQVALGLSQSKYTWLIGDRSRLYVNAINEILSIIRQGEYDLLIVNSGMKLNETGFAWKNKKHLKLVTGFPSAVYNDDNLLLSNIGWYMVLIGSTVFNASFVKTLNFDKYAPYSSFDHVLPVFDSLAQRDFSVYWFDRQLIYTAPGGSSGWLHDTFEIWIEQRIKAAESLPSSYSFDAKRAWIKAGGVKSGLFSAKVMSFLRGNNIYSFSIFKKYYSRFPLVSNTPRPALFLIAVTPSIVFRAIEKLVRLFVPDLVRISPKK
jgi:abequosyltransferase